MKGIPLNMDYEVPTKGYEKFWEGVKRGEVWYTVCRNCRRSFFPPQLQCPSCRTEDVEWMRSEGVGEVMTFSIVSAKPQGYQSYPDYIIAVVRLKEGVDIMCWLKEKLNVGDRVKISSDGSRFVGERL